MEAQRSRVLVRGLFAGLASYLTVVVLFAGFNLVTGRPLFATALQLGAVLVGGDVPPAGQVLAWNGVHLAVLLALGLLCALLVHEWELHPDAWYAVFFALTAGAVALTLAVGIFAAEYAGVVSWTAVVLVTLLAAGVMAAVLAWSERLPVPL